MSAKTYDGQTARFLATIATCMPSLSSDVMQGWIDNPTALKRALEALSPPKEGAKTPRHKTEFLTPPTRLPIPANENRFDPAAFFKSRSGLYVWDGMRKVIAGAPALDTTPASKLAYRDLKKEASDREIKGDLAKDHEVELSEIAALINAQQGGKDGPLLNNGCANIFYVRGFAVNVHWGADDREWRVDVWGLDVGRWYAGGRVFSRN